MAGALGDRRGGIRGLLELLDQYQEAVEYDLICLPGRLRLRDAGTARLPWRDLLVIVKQAPRSSALVRAIHGADQEWTLDNQLRAATADALHVANWQRSGGKKKDKPKPIPRPGVEQDKTYGKEAIPIHEMADWLGWETQLAGDN